MHFLSVAWNLVIEFADFLFTEVIFTHTNDVINFCEGKHSPSKGFPEYNFAYDSCQVCYLLYLGHTNGQTSLHMLVG